MADRPKWFLKVLTDTGKKYSLEVKGEISTVTGEMLKPKLAESSGVPAARQMLLYKGREIGDKETFDKLGIKPDEELVLSKKVPETKYYLEMLTDAVSAFDKVVEGAGGVEEAIRLGDEPKLALKKELCRKVKAMKKHLKNLQDELGSCTGSEAHDIRFNAEAQKVLDREQTYSVITDEIVSPNLMDGSPTPDTDPLLTHKSKVYLPPIMENFYKRTHGLYTLIESVRRLADSSPIAGKLTRASVDLVMLADDVQASTTSNDIQRAIMASVLMDVRLLLVKTVRKFLMLADSMATRVTDEFDEAEFLTAFAGRASTGRVGIGHKDIIGLLTNLDKGVVDKEVALRVLKETAGWERGEDEVEISTPAVVDVQRERSEPNLTEPVAHHPSPEQKQPQTQNVEPATTAADEIDDTQVADALRKGDLWRARLVLFYLHYRPDNLSSVERILHEYKGAEDKLFCHLFDKYRTSDIEKDDLRRKLLAIAAKHKISADPQPSRSAAIDDTEGGCLVM